MDTMRSEFGGAAGWICHDGDTLDLAGYESDDTPPAATALQPAGAAPAAESPPPPAIGQDERRMQVRAYNHWADLLGERAFPDIADLNPAGHTDFRDYSVLLDFSAGIEDPVVLHLGARLAEECGTANPVDIGQLSDVPVGSLLSRITDHYVQILSRQSPIGFEAEFVNRAGRLIVYRGILLPFSSDDRKVDHVFGVLNWKEVAEPADQKALVHELSHALDAGENTVVRERDGLPAPLSRRLRALTPREFDTLPEDGPEFSLLMARRLSSGNVMLLGEVPFDADLIRRASEAMDRR